MAVWSLSVGIFGYLVYGLMVDPLVGILEYPKHGCWQGPTRPPKHKDPTLWF